MDQPVIAPPMLLREPQELHGTWRYRHLSPVAAPPRVEMPAPVARVSEASGPVADRVREILASTWPEHRLVEVCAIDDVQGFRSVWGIERVIANQRGDVCRAATATLLLRCAAQADPGELVGCVVLVGTERCAAFVDLWSGCLVAASTNADTATLHRSV